MGSVPSHSRTRKTHRRSLGAGSSYVGSRRTHGASGYLGPIEGASEVYDQIGIDGVVQPGDLTPGSVGSGQLRDESLILSKFTLDIRPVAIVDALPPLPDPAYPVGSTVVLTTDGKLYRNDAGAWSASILSSDVDGLVGDGIEVVSALPSLPDAAYPVGRVVFLDTNGKLYRNVSNAWTAAVATSDLTGQITSTQITDGAISTPKLAANAVTANELAANAVTANKILAGAVTAGKVAADAIGVAEIAAGAVQADKLAANAVVAGKIAAGAVGASEIAAGAVQADKIAAGAVTIGALAFKGINLLDNSSFEVAPTTVGFGTEITVNNQVQPYWLSGTVGCVGYYTSGFARTGTKVLRIQGNGVNSFPSLVSNSIAVVPGRTYRLGAWMARGGGSTLTGRTRLDTLDKNGATVATAVASFTNNSGAINYQTRTWTCPTDASVSYVRVLCFIDAGTPPTTEAHVWEDVELIEVPANLINDAATVSIDGSGITIESGALTFKDTFGSTVLNGAGFGQQWMKFLTNRFYNADFAQGSTSDIPVSEVSGAGTQANYEASLSSGLPYWVVKTSGGVLSIVADAAASGGKALRSNSTAGAQVNEFYQDIPVVPGRGLQFARVWRYSIPAGTVTVEFGFDFRDVNHAVVAAGWSYSFVYSGTQASYIEQPETGIYGTDVPKNAMYIRARWKVTHSAPLQNVYFSEVMLQPYLDLVDISSTAQITLTTARQDVPSCSATIGAGTYLIFGVFDVDVTVAGIGAMVGILDVDGVEYVGEAHVGNTLGRWTVSQVWVATKNPTGAGVAKLRAYKTAAGGTSRVYADHSKIIAWRIA